MALTLDDLQEASFRGARFLIDTSSSTGGRKSVTHEYPNTDKRFVEDLGELRETYTMTGIISGNNYVAERDNLIAQLKTGGSGELVHPFFGSVTVFAKPYSLSQNLNELGVARFSMTFERTNESTFPRVNANNRSLIDDVAGNTITAAGTDFTDLFSVTKKFPKNYTDAKEALTSLTDRLQIIPDTVLKVTSASNTYGADLTSFTDGINLLIEQPSALLGNIKGTLGAFGELGRTAQDKFDLLTDLFDFGDDDVVIIPTTQKKIERKQNRDILNAYVQTNVLSQSYNIVTSLSFDTEDDIKEVEAILEEQYNKVVALPVLSNDTITSLKNLRVEVRDFFDQQSVNAFKVSEIETYPIPMTVLAYQYYGDTSKTQQLIDLNNTLEPSFVEGTVKVLV